jgi:hypothetical protein
VSRLWSVGPEGRPLDLPDAVSELPSEPMSTAENRAASVGAGTPDAIELVGIYDDPDRPTEFTVFSPGPERFLTEWVSVEPDAVVSLYRMS